MINIINKVDCCGCNACADACAHKALSFQVDNEGFMYPIVDLKKCTDCGLCERVCPIINIDKLKKNDFDIPECYAVQNKNLESLFNSTSGSAFAALAERMYKMGGYVGGAIFNDDYSVSQFISADKADLQKLRNSKYVQSDSQGFYKEVRNLLRQGNKVLVCGLPCQIAALRAFLHKDYENLITVDLICLGINSPKILRGYLDYLEDKYGSKVVYYKAKNKELGWRKLTTKVVFENGKVVYEDKDKSYFTYGYVSTHAYARPSCYDCKFKGFPRIADITIGDMWGAERLVDRDMDNDLGTSVIMFNSQKGKIFYQEMKSAFKEKHITLEDVLKNNKALVKSMAKPSIDREEFYKDLSSKPFKDVAKKYIKLPSEQSKNVKQKVKNIVKYLYYTVNASKWSITTLWQNIYYNLFCKQFKTDVLSGKFIIFYKHSIVNVSKTAKVELAGVFHYGTKRVKGSHLESRLLVESNSTLKLGSGRIFYGADIEVFPKSEMEIGHDVVFNLNATIICDDKITIGDYVRIGRDVTIRDNSGNHFMSRRTFKNKRAISIGQHTWLCEKVIVMPGTKTGTGVVVSAGSLASGKYPNFTLVSGSPAVVVDEEIYWKA